MHKTYYWSLVITSYFASAALWSREGEETAVVSFGPEVTWEHDEELAAAVDSSLSGIIANMPDDAGEPTKTVFGVMSSWVTDGHIKKEYLALIREICGKLSLSPVGFVVLPEALSHEVKQNEGGPLSGITIGVSRNNLEVTLFRMGALSGTVDVGRSISLSEDLIEALSRFSSNDPLPSRFILYGATQEESQDIIHLLSSVSWKDAHEKLTFLHEPKIEVADSQRILVSICVAGSSEMGPVKSLVVPQKEGKTQEVANVVESDMSLNDLGFAVDADISKISPHFADESEEEVSSEESIDEDAQEESTAFHATHAPRKFTAKNRLQELATLPARALHSFRRQDDTLPVERAHLVASPRRAQAKVKRVLIGGGALVGFVLLGIIVAWYTLPKADITISLSPRTLTSRENFILRTGISSPDIEGKVLPAETVTKTVSGADSAPSTGTKTVGEKAVGKVTIRNGTSSAVKLPAGALLVGPNDLKFVVNESASVSAATSPTTPGTATIPATAAAIGADYNVAQDTSLKVGSFLSSEIDAVVSEAFAGGSSRQISAVSKSDIDGLEKLLTQKLISDAQTQMVEEVPEGYIFVTDSITTKVVSKTFDHKVGDEASQINLNLEVQADAFSVPNAAIEEAAQKLLASQVPSGYSFRPEQVETSFDVQKGSELSANVGLTAHLLPDVNPDDVARAISGKRFATANDYLSTIPGFVRASITVSPVFPDAIRFLPFNAKRIGISIEAEK